MHALATRAASVDSDPVGPMSARFVASRSPSWSRLGRRLARPRELPWRIDLHCIRHGETVTNARGQVTGACDVALTPRGVRQAERIGRRLAPEYEAAFSSTLGRARETLRVAAGAGGVQLGVVYPDSRLNERSLGVLELTTARYLPEFGRGDLAYAPEGGESYLDVARKLLWFLMDLADFAERQGFSRILLATHMGPLRILSGLMDEATDPTEVLARSFRNAELVELEWTRLSLPPFLARFL